MYTRSTVAISAEEVKKRGWDSDVSHGEQDSGGNGGGGSGEKKRHAPIDIEGPDAQRIISSLLRRMLQIRTRVKSAISIEIEGLKLPLGGELTLALNDITPGSISDRRELLENLSGIVGMPSAAEIRIAVPAPQPDCGLCDEIDALLAMNI